MTNYFYTEEMPDDKTLIAIRMTDEFYEFFSARNLDKETPHFSFFNIFFRLYGLMPKDFFQYISATYSATIMVRPSGAIRFYFTKQTNADDFIHDANARMRYLVDCNQEKGE